MPERALSLPVLSSRPRRVYFVSLGCAKNKVDTEVMLGVVQAEGHELVDDPDRADTLVVNTCGFIEAAKEESIDAILELAAVKQRGDGRARLVVAGCLSQRDSEELARELPEVDHFLGSADMLGLREILRGEGRRAGVTPLGRGSWLPDHESPRRLYGRRHSAFLKIAEGCDRPCAFCTIPRLRGPQRSRSVASVVAEARALAAAGVRELCLVAQDSTTYGWDLAGRGAEAADLERLLDALCEVPGVQWIRLHYAYPTAVTEGLVERIAARPQIASYLDVPLQHVDSGVLKRMRRGYGERQVRALVERLAAVSPRIWLRTTMLVGHPGETEDAFSRLRDFVEEGAIDHLGVFAWSREEGTPSALQPGRVPAGRAAARAEELMHCQAAASRARQSELVGSVLDVMIDGPSEESEFLLDGRHEGQALDVDGKVIVCDGGAAPGEIVPVSVIAATEHDLVGRVTSA